jgi:DNA-directed RNA polymerase subunit RPC12/RpoP
MTWLTDPNPEAVYRCGRCKELVPLAGYRLLYGGTRRPLRCRECEAATATSPGMAKYYGRRFESVAASKRPRDAADREHRYARERAWVEAHREEDLEYKRAWYRLHAPRIQAKQAAAYAANRAQKRAEANERYAATHRTPEAKAARKAAKQQRRRDERFSWRAELIALVATSYRVTPDELRHPEGLGDYKAVRADVARRMAAYLLHEFRRYRDRHPAEEIAVDLSLTVHDLRLVVGQVARSIRRRRTDSDGAEAYAVRERLRPQALAAGLVGCTYRMPERGTHHVV